MLKNIAPLFLAPFLLMSQYSTVCAAAPSIANNFSNPQTPTIPVNPVKIGQLNLKPLPFISPRPARIGLDPRENKALPVDIECDIARLLVLEETPAVTEDGNTPFAVVAEVYASLLTLFATDDPSQQIMYTENVKPYIKQNIDPYGNYFYTAIPGEEKRLLGYSHSLSTSKFQDVLCKDQNTFFTLDANVDSNQQTYFWVHFTRVLFTEDDSNNEQPHYQWINHTGTGNYYDFYFTKDHRQATQNIGNLCVKSFTGSIWVGIKDEANPTHDWTVTGNKIIGLSTISNDENPALQDSPTPPSPQQNPSEPPTALKTPNKEKNSAWEDFQTNGAGSAWEDFQKNGAGSAWEDFQKNGAGSAWEASLHQHSNQTQNLSSLQNQQPSTPPPSSENNSSQQQNPPVDKETEARIQLALKLYQEGNSLSQIENTTGFTEAELRYLLSHLSQ